MEIKSLFKNDLNEDVYLKNVKKLINEHFYTFKLTMIWMFFNYKK